MRKIVQNLLLLIVVCIGIILVTRNNDGFSTQKPGKNTTKSTIPPYLPYDTSDKRDYCVPRSSTGTQFIPYFKSSFKTDQGWKFMDTMNFFNNHKEYYCVAPNPIQYKKNDKVERKNKLNALQNETPVGGLLGRYNISNINTTDCANFYKPQVTKGMTAEIPCVKMTYI